MMGWITIPWSPSRPSFLALLCCATSDGAVIEPVTHTSLAG